MRAMNQWTQRRDTYRRRAEQRLPMIAPGVALFLVLGVLVFGPDAPGWFVALFAAAVVAVLVGCAWWAVLCRLARRS